MIRWLAFVLVWAVALPSVAHADIRVWEEEGVEDPHEGRYVDLSGYLQPGYIWRQDDDTVGEVDLPLADDHFWLRHARVGLRARLYPWLLFRMELETTPAAALRDGYVDFAPLREVAVRVGQFKVPFLQTFLFSDARQGFIDHPLYVPASPDRPFLRYLSPRDIGVMVHGLVGSEDRGPALEYGVGLFLGRGANQTRDVDGVFLFAARLQGHLFGVPEGAGAENDLARNARPHVAVGAGAYTNCDDREQYNRGFTLDAELRWQGVYASAGFVRFRNGPAHDGNLVGSIFGYDSDEACAPDPTAPLPNHIAWGAHVQAQYALPSEMIVDGQTFELLLRFDVAQPNDPDDGFLGGDETSQGYIPPINYTDSDNPPNQTRLTFGANWYPTNEPTLRLSLNYQLRREAEQVAPTPDRRIVGISNDILWL